MFKDDWLLNQINQAIKFFAILIFNRYNETERQAVIIEHSNDIYGREKYKLLDDNNFCKAEDTVYSLLEDSSINYQSKSIYAYLLYEYLSKVDENILEENNFSTQEVLEGIIFLKDKFFNL